MGFNKMKRNAFTLAELLIVLIFIGTLSGLLVLSVKNKASSKSKLMYRKAFSTAERRIYEMINDENAYPTSNGFKNSNKSEYKNAYFGGTTNTEKYSKFCKLFSYDLNTITKDDSCLVGNASNNHNWTTPAFVTSDGISWHMPVQDFSASNKYEIWVDTNYKDKPNCEYNATNCQRPDRFRIGFTYDGKVYAVGNIAQEYLTDNN